jgi:hypothetical protein
LTFWIVAGTILFLLVALCFLRVGISAGYSERGAEVFAKVGFFRLQLYPERKVLKPRRKKAVQAVPDEAKEEEKKQKGGPLELFGKYYDLVLGLLRDIKKTARIDLLKVRFVAAAKDDAAGAAILYGRAWAAEGIITAVLENNIRVLKKDIDITVDYLAEKPSIFCRADISAPLGGLIVSVFRAAKAYLEINKKEKAV